MIILTREVDLRPFEGPHEEKEFIPRSAVKPMPMALRFTMEDMLGFNEEIEACHDKEEFVSLGDSGF